MSADTLDAPTVLASAQPAWSVLEEDASRLPLSLSGVQCVVTSPPYYALRDYGLPPTHWPAVEYAPLPGLPSLSVPGCDPACDHDWADESREIDNRTTAGLNLHREGTSGGSWDQPRATTVTSGYCRKCGGWRGCLGLEPTLEAYVAHLVLIFRGVRETMADGGTLWLNLGDGYNGGGMGGGANKGGSLVGTSNRERQGNGRITSKLSGSKPKDLMGVPWRVALALQADGWTLRNDIVWSKSSPMPESVTDRCTRSHEYLFMFSKGPRYYYDRYGERTTQSSGTIQRFGDRAAERINPRSRVPTRSDFAPSAGEHNMGCDPAGRNLWTVWWADDEEEQSHGGILHLPNEPSREDHYAAYPSMLPTRAIRLGTSDRGQCPTCGLPWGRVVRRASVTRERPNELTKRTHAAGTGNACPNTVAGVEATTLGWAPQCGCYGVDLLEQPPRQKKNESEKVFSSREEEWLVRWRELHQTYVRLPTVPQLVLDPFSGTGTTGVACKRLGRRFVGLEPHPGYAATARRRISTALRDDLKSPRRNKREEGPDLFAQAPPAKPAAEVPELPALPEDPPVALPENPAAPGTPAPRKARKRKAPENPAPSAPDPSQNAPPPEVPAVPRNDTPPETPAVLHNATPETPAPLLDPPPPPRPGWFLEPRLQAVLDARGIGTRSRLVFTCITRRLTTGEVLIEAGLAPADIPTVLAWLEATGLT